MLGQDKVLGLEAGADDYISEPMTDEELVARVHVITRRRQIPDRLSEPLVLHDLKIDFARREVSVQGQIVSRSRIEYDLLHTLVINRGQVLSHKQLLTKVWGPEYLDDTQYLWVAVSRLRKKLEPKSTGIHYIRTQPGIGYYFVTE